MSKIDKLRAQERSERLLGNCSLADNLLAKIASMENKGLVPVVQKVDDITAERRRVEAAWSAMDPACSVVILEIQPGLSHAVRRTCTMEIALPLLKQEKARLLGLVTDKWVNVQADTSNTPPLSDRKGTGPIFI